MPEGEGKGRLIEYIESLNCESLRGGALLWCGGARALRKGNSEHVRARNTKSDKDLCARTL
jgi:hypothetical protein